jgi:hypothetical protein
MLQTFWELNRQNIRKIADTAMGVIGGYAFFTSEWGVMAFAFLGLVVNYAWFWLDNRSKVTVAGLEAAGQTSTAVAVEDAMVDAKKGA